MKLPVQIRRSSLLTKAVVLLVAVCATATLVSQRAQLREKQAEARDLQQQVAALEQENQQRKSEIQDLGSDDSVKSIARRELGLVEGGEIVFTDKGN